MSEELQVAMLFPDDESVRESVRATLILNRLAQAGEGEIPIDASLLRSSLSGPSLGEARQRMSDRTIRGFIAGQILRGALAMRSRGDQPKIEPTVRDLVADLERYETFGGKPKAYGRRSIKSAWSEYRSVAHYWAASNIAYERLTSDNKQPEALIVGAGTWMDLHNRHPQAIIAGAAAVLGLSNGATLRGAKGPEPLLDPTQALTVPADFPLPGAAAVPQPRTAKRA